MSLIGRTVLLQGTGRRVEVLALIGEGGQGAVYEVRTATGEVLALKWYNELSATGFQRHLITDLVERGAPNHRFLWPSELAALPGEHGFGYVMQLRPAKYVGLASLLDGGVRVSLRVLCTIGWQLADSYLRLHTQGLCYRDINFGNVFFDPATGDTLICDNDNVGVDGESVSAVMGTKRLMAPEIVRGEARPSGDTDLYSLSVLLFYLLMVGHPLMGMRELAYPVWNEDAELDLFGRHPVFVFDPFDSSNRPAPGVHAAVVENWNIYPDSLRRLFVEAFTTGLHDPANGRVGDSEWRAELVRCSDLLRPCGRCGAMNFFDRAQPGRVCWHCHVWPGRPICLVLDKAFVVLSEGVELCGHHLGIGVPYDFTAVLARVTRHPDREGVFGLTNLGTQPWTVRPPDGVERQVEPARSVELIHGVSVDFGRASGRLELG